MCRSWDITVSAESQVGQRPLELQQTDCKMSKMGHAGLMDSPVVLPLGSGRAQTPGSSDTLSLHPEALLFCLWESREAPGAWAGKAHAEHWPA